MFGSKLSCQQEHRSLISLFLLNFTPGQFSYTLGNILHNLYFPVTILGNRLSFVIRIWGIITENVKNLSNFKKLLWNKPQIIGKSCSIIVSRCKESVHTEAYFPCSLALLRIQFLDAWARYNTLVKVSTYFM